MGRIEEICSYIDNSNSFADIGCDHGYCTLHALKSGKCQRAVISDVSAKSLAKAERLLSSYIEQGRCKSVCCDGLQKIDSDCEQVLIAGMGGMEIIKILTEGFIPQRFILQPMKNAEELRKFLIANGCKITADDIFFDNNYYFIVKGERSGGTLSYSEEEYAFGKDSLNNPVFKEFAQKEVEKLSAYNVNSALDEKINFIKKAARLK
ncbi:MAG: tRNA (adenine(22)-N(1))-methyltransferase [Candidatus Coproplasma sp.]